MLNAVFMKSPDVVFRKIGDEAVLVPLVNNVGDLSSVYTFNETGARLWEFFDGVRDVHEICRLMGDEFDAPAPLVESDVSEFIGELSAINFLLRV